MKRFLCTAALILQCSGSAPAQTQQLYRTTLIQAAPGRLLYLIDQLKQRHAAEQDAGEHPSWIIRHSQGDMWDLLVLTPIGSYHDYFSPGRRDKRDKALREAGLPASLHTSIAWQEDVFVTGPALEEARPVMNSGNFYHVEMFVALPGRQQELLRQRGMENIYLKELQRPQNLIFTRDMGAAWDSFTIGAYRDIKHYAESADIPAEKQEEAARAAGFTSAAQIGPYLRMFIRSHHDTLGTAVR
jgi:hypothetical protein